MAAAAPGTIERQSVFGVDARQRAGERILALGHDHQVDMVGHQAVAQEAHAGTRGVMAEKVQVKTPIIWRVEDGSAIIATLGDMMGNARKDDAGSTGHKNEWNNRGKCLRKMRPLFPAGISDHIWTIAELLA